MLFLIPRGLLLSAPMYLYGSKHDAKQRGPFPILREATLSEPINESPATAEPTSRFA